MPTETQPRILMVTRNLPPLIGGMERLNQHICIELARDFSVQVCGPEGGAQYLPDHIPYFGSPALPLGKFLIHNAWQTIRQAIAFKPHLIYAGSGVSAPAAELVGKIAGAKVVCYLHGLDIIAEHLLYKTFFLPRIRSCDAYLVNSLNTKQLAESRGMPCDRITILHPGVTIPSMTNSVSLASEFRKKIDAGNRPILLTVGRITSRKGIIEFIQHCLPVLAKEIPDILYVIIGEEPKKSLNTNRAGLTEKICTISKQTGLVDHVKLMGHVEDNTLTAAYFASQVHVFPIQEQEGDVEGFGMVAIEAAAHGLPTIAFASGGVPDAVSPGISGILIPPHRYDLLNESIILQLREGAIMQKQCLDFSKYYSWENFGTRLRKFFHQQLSA